jgi:putative membrane-bound dehydrogenase-like protein
VAAGWKLPEGFKATLFASEPDVRQPIDIKLDDRGRLWVAEAYSYKEWQHKGEDRILIFEDTNGDGIADTRKIFKSGFQHLSSIEIGFGGVWVLDTPNLLFIPDTNGDDVPDGEPKIQLDGWTDKAGHNMVSGLTWGPDGWLYGRHGITQPSLVGTPGTPETQRTFVEPGIWRFHPVSHKFEITVKGTTNPWGLDWDADGEMFMSNNVNGHLWHVLPGALYERMFGTGNVPYDFERLHMIGEATHYPSSGDWKADWSNAEKGRDTTSNMGGGHSHCGLMIYQGDNWPAAYQGHFFMNNTHGRRVNEESVQPNGATYLSKHLGDVAVANTLWFKGVSLLCGPDGGVYLSDWSDNGECHDDDGVHRSSGRIYKITYGTPKPADLHGGLQTWSQAELTRTVALPNNWFYRHGRRLLQEASVAGKKFTEQALLQEISTTPQQQLSALWLRQTSNSLPEAELAALLHHANPHQRLWAARLLTDRQIGFTEILAQAAKETDLLALSHFAGLVHQWPDEDAWKLATAVAQNSATAAPVLELLVWYAVEPLAGKFPARAVDTYGKIASAKVREFVARRFASTMENEACRTAVGRLLANPTHESMTGISTALAGRMKVPAPANWPEVRSRLLTEHASQATSIGVAFGDGEIFSTLRQQVSATNRSVEQRNQALQALVSAQAPNLAGLIAEAFAQPALRLTAIRAQQILTGEAVPTALLGAWAGFSAAEKSAAVDVLATRSAWAGTLLAALGKGALARSDISLAQARQISFLKEASVLTLLDQYWGKISSTSDEKKKVIEKYKLLLASGTAGDAGRGHAVFTKTCATCHTLFDEGGKLGPNLTGGGRKNLDYILLNVVDPNASVPRDYQMTIVVLKDGQTLAGTVPQEDDKTVTLQTVTERRVLEKSATASITRQPISWMPEGLLQPLSETELRDLLAYLGR